MGDGATDAVGRRQHALVELEAPVRQAAGDLMLDARVDALALIADVEVAAHGLGQAQARLSEIEAHGRGAGRARREETAARREEILQQAGSSCRRRNATPAGMRLDWNARATAASPMMSPSGKRLPARCARKVWYITS